MSNSVKINPMTSRLAHHSNLLFAIAIVTVLGTLLIPLPTIMLDVMIACSISLAVTVLIITLSTNESLELSSFPSLLLFVTLFRLSLNVASTRLILLNGSAGKIIDAFGNFVAGGNLVVGMVIFLILVIIQFVVITKGSSRISEVSARFVLDAMPGKQMAIDADLNAGTITDEQASDRREAIIKESEFYGAMDGASKFISGDAIAGLIITAVNIVGGIIIGYSRDMSVEDAVRTYSILSIGDGLVSQIPSIVIAISSGFLVTKTSSKQSMSNDLTFQFLKRSQPLIATSVVLALIAFVPGFPTLVFLTISGCVGYFAYVLRAHEQSEKKNVKNADKNKPKSTDDDTPVEELLDVDVLSVIVGVKLISMVDPRKKSSIFDRIGALRRKFAQQLGVILPLIRIKDNITLESNSYEIRLHDHIIATGRLEPDRFLAMDSGAVIDKVKGIETQEPVYGLPALWIAENDKERAEIAGYTVIDPESVLITHLSEVLQNHAHEILSREDVQQLVERLRKTQPSLVGETIGELIPVGLLQKVLKNLLVDGIPIRDLTSIIESLSENANKTKNAVMLTELARKSLARTITEMHKNPVGSVSAITLDPEFEYQLISSLKSEGDTGVLSLSPDVSMGLTQMIANAWKGAMEKAYDSVIMICDARLRQPLSEIIRRAIPRLPVVAYDEIINSVKVEPIESIALDVENQSTPQQPALDSK